MAEISDFAENYGRCLPAIAVESILLTLSTSYPATLTDPISSVWVIVPIYCQPTFGRQLQQLQLTCTSLEPPAVTPSPRKQFKRCHPLSLPF
jgi:hypothetical protein